MTFAPTSASPLTKTALLNVSVAAPATSQSVSLTGTIVVPTFNLSPTSLSFGKQLHGTTSAPQTVMLTNTGSVASLTISNIVLSGTNPKQFIQTNTWGTFPSDPCAGKFVRRQRAICADEGGVAEYIVGCSRCSACEQSISSADRRRSVET